MTEYPIVIVPLKEEDGGGYAAMFPDLPGCMSDGDTPQEATENALDALKAWMEVQKDRGMEIPAPNSAARDVSAKVKSLMEALKAALDYADEADNRIEMLEAALEQTIAEFNKDWKRSSVIIAHSVKQARISAVH